LLIPRERFAILSNEKIGLILGKKIMITLPQKFFLRVAGQLLASRVGAHKSQMPRILYENRIGDVVEDGSEEGPGFIYFLFNFLALCNVLAGAREAGRILLVVKKNVPMLLHKLDAAIRKADPVRDRGGNTLIEFE